MKRFIFLSILILFASFLFGADDPKFTNHSYARLSFVTGSTYIQRASDVGYEEGVLNMPIEAGDRIGTTDGRAEIYLGKNNYVRLDNDSKIDFLSLPNKESDLTQIRLWSGSAYFSIGLIEKEKTFEIHTADVSVYFLDKKPSPKILMAALGSLRPHILTGVPLIFEKIFHKQVVPQLTNNRITKLITRSELGRKLFYRLAGRKILRAFGGRLECAVIGGASLNNEVETFMREGRIPYTIGYGLSECSPLVSASPVVETKIGSVGKAIRDVHIRIDEPSPETGVGEILVKGPNVMRGYYKNDEENALIFAKEGWLHTGDRGYLDEDGYLFIRGRSKNVIVGPSGENIYPEVIEDKLKESLFVEESLAYEKDGKLIARIYLDYEHLEKVHVKKGEHVTPETIRKVLEEIRREVNEKLPHFSQIRQILEQTEPFEKTPTNKVKRRAYINY